jgi:hypothetical protein
MEINNKEDKVNIKNKFKNVKTKNDILNKIESASCLVNSVE